VVLSNDTELKGYLAMLEGKPVYRGIQAEWTDWMGCFSPEVLARLDFVLTDAMTMPGPGGRRMKLWEPGAEIGDPERFMDRYVDWHVEILEKEPLDILGNVTWLPAALAADYDTLWTPARMKRVVDRGGETPGGPGDQLQLQTPQTSLPRAGQGGRREVRVRIQRAVSEDGPAGIQCGDGPGTGPAIIQHVQPGSGWPESRPTTQGWLASILKQDADESTSALGENAPRMVRARCNGRSRLRHLGAEHDQRLSAADLDRAVVPLPPSFNPV